MFCRVKILIIQIILKNSRIYNCFYINHFFQLLVIVPLGAATGQTLIDILINLIRLLYDFFAIKRFAYKNLFNMTTKNCFYFILLLKKIFEIHNN